MKNIIKAIFTYGIIFILFTIFYLSLFHTPLFSYQRVLFYRGLILLAISILFSLFLSFFVWKKNKISYERLFSAIIVSASINLSLFVVFPVTFERSVTMYLLKTLKSNSGNICRGLTRLELEEKLIKEYVVGKAIEKRANEQKIIGFIKEDNHCLQLTPQALKFLKFAEIVGKVYDVK